MNRLLRYVLAGVLACAAGCDIGAPDEPEEPRFVRLRVNMEAEDGETFASGGVQAETALLPGASAAYDTLRLGPARLYTGSVVFFDQHGRRMNERIQSQAELYQVFYSVQGEVPGTIRTTDTEATYGRNWLGADSPVGLQFELEVAPGELVGPGGLRIQLGYFKEQPKRGSIVLEVPPVVDVVVPATPERVPGPAPLAHPIARLVWTLTGADTTLQVEATNALGLHLGAVEADTVTMEVDRAPIRFDGSLRLFDAAGNDLTEQLRAEKEWHQVQYTSSFPGLPWHATDEDLDAHGLPLGFDTWWQGPPLTGARLVGGHLRLRLLRYDPNKGYRKGGHADADVGEVLFDVTFTFNYYG